MTEQSYLNPQNIKSQCTGAINNLNEDIKSLEVTKKAINNFMNASELQGDAFTNLKESMGQYLELIDKLIAANNADISDFKTLANLVGSEVLDGGIIKPNQRRAWDSKSSNENRASDYRCKASGADDPVYAAYYSGMAWYHDRLAGSDYQTYCYWTNKENKFDTIEDSTRNLFEDSHELRALCKCQQYTKLC